MKEIIQVAGIIDADEAALLMKCGVDYLGFPMRLPVNKEDLTEDEAAEVIKQIHPPHKSVLITYLDKSDEIIAFCKKLNVTIVQLHGRVEVDELKKLRMERPDIEIIKSLVINKDNFNELQEDVETLAPVVDFFITDTFDPITGASGATGKTHDWNISHQLIELSPKPVILAGGLNPSNVRDAILATDPAGVDVHTGVETPGGRKDFNLVQKFITESRQAFSMLK